MLSEPKSRMTRQRQAILQELRSVNSHPTADEVYNMVRRRLPRISLGTIYRNLEILSESGIIRKIEIAGTQRRFDGKVEKHYHVHCVECGRVEDVSIKPITIAEEDLCDIGNYEITGHELVLIGICPVCKARD